MAIEHDSHAQTTHERFSTGNLMESKTSHLDDLLNEKLEEAFREHASNIQLHDIAKIAGEYSPIDLAIAATRLPSEARTMLYEHLPDWSSKTDFMINTDRNTRTLIFRYLTDEEIKKLIESMPVDEAVWVLDDLSDRRLRRLFELLDATRSNMIREMQQHDRHSAGRLMTNEFFAFTMDVTIGEAASYIRNHPGIELTRRIFVLNRTGELQGYVPARNLIVNPSHLPLRQVMQPVHHKITPDTPREEMVDIAERYKIPVLPVVNARNILVGVITYEDIVEVMEDIADETIAMMAGTREDVSAHDPIFKCFLSRAPWLIVTLCGGLVNAANMSYFEGLLSPWMAFAVFFVPLITGMSGNVGLQCSTALVRSMAIGVLSAGGRAEAIMKELSIGLLTGLIFGVICGLTVYTLNATGVQHLEANPLAVGVVVCAGLFGACLTATLLGVFSPLFFARIGVDPAVSSGPIVTAFNDVFSMVMYFLIAQFISAFFFVSS